MKKTILATLLLIFAISSVCLAAENNRYVSIKKNDSFEYFIDTKSVRFEKDAQGKVDNNRFSAWFKKVYTELGREKEIEKLKIQGNPKYDDLSFSLIKFEFLDAERQSAFKQAIMYDSKKNLLSSTVAQKISFGDIAPETQGELFFNAASDYIHKQK